MRNDECTSAAAQEKPRRCWRGSVALLLFFFAATILLQWCNHAYRSDIGDDPDEPAHVVTSLMMRDYLAGGVWRGEHPMTFAQRYYDSFPKVALGHYPPGFYLVAGVWLLPVASKTALLLLIALLAAVVALITVKLAERVGIENAWIAGVWFLALQLTQKQTMLVMSDLMLCAGFLLSVLMFARFLDQPTARNSLLFGVLASATMLTKASGAALALVPPLAIAMTGRWRLLLDRRLWLAPVPVLLTAIPWTLMTYKITKEGMVDETVAEYLPEAAKFYLRALVPALGGVLVVGALFEVTSSISRWVTKGERPSPLAASLAGMVIGTLALYMVSPSGLSSRYLLPLAPVAILAAVHFVERNAARFPGAWGEVNAPRIALALVLIMQTVFGGSRARSKEMSGFSDAVMKLLAADTSGRVLISSDARGEGALTAELAFRVANRAESPWQVIRASKFMASSDWLGRDYHAKFADAAALLAALKSEHVAWIIQDEGVQADRDTEHHELMRKLVEDAGAVEVVARCPSTRWAGVPAAELLLYRVK